MCRIVVPFFLHRKIFNLMHATPVAESMGEYKTLYRISSSSFGLECVLILKNGSSNVLIVRLDTAGDVVVKN